MGDSAPDEVLLTGGVEQPTKRARINKDAPSGMSLAHLQRTGTKGGEGIPSPPKLGGSLHIPVSSEKNSAAAEATSKSDTSSSPRLQEDYELFLDRKLGEGMAGVVHVGRQRSTNKLVAVKTVHRTHNTDECGARAEAFLLDKARGHANVIELHGMYTDAFDIHLVQDLCLGGELFDHIIEFHSKGFTEKSCSIIFRQIIAAVQHCHGCGICHRDLKPENLLLLRHTHACTKTSIKLVDFGLAHDMSALGSAMNESVGSPAYIAPEVYATMDEFSNKSYGKECDLWSCGVILYIMLKGRFPFASKEDAIAGNIEDPSVGSVSLQAQELVRGSSPCEIPSKSHIRPTLSLIQGLLCVDPKKRLSSEQVSHLTTDATVT